MNIALVRLMCHRTARRLAALIIVSAVLTGSVHADTPPSRLNALAGLTVSDKYLTPRGMIVQDEGVTIQTLFLGFLNVYRGEPEAFLNNVTLVGGAWSDYATDAIAESVAPGSDETHFIEIDPIFGVSFGFAQNFKLDVTYTAFAMQILDIGTSEHLEVKLSYNDSKLLGAFALHPYLLFWKELNNKATAAANFGIPSSHYFEVGVAPSVTVGAVKLEAPMRVLLPATDFYGETFSDSSTVGLWEVGLKASTDLKSIPRDFGFWNVHLGVRYMKFVDKNLQQLATDGGFGSRTKDTAQVYSGLTIFF